MSPSEIAQRIRQYRQQHPFSDDTRLKMIVGCFLAGLVCFIWFAPTKPIPTVDVRDMKIEIADTAVKRKKGLSGRRVFSETQAMLFVFDHSDTYSFWMKDMRFSLDLIWIDHGKIVEVQTLHPPAKGATPETFTPSHTADRVLEVREGVAEKRGLKPGVHIVLPSL